jgi:acetone carboxylase gamma subunit
VIYGVLLKGDQLDAPATEALRREMRQSRREHPRAQALPLRALRGKVLREVTPNLAVRSDPDSPSKERKRWCCMSCANDLGPLSGNYKHACATLTAPITASNPHVGDYKRYIDDEPIFRQYFCPSCGRLVENEVARAGEPALQDIELKL